MRPTRGPSGSCGGSYLFQCLETCWIDSMVISAKKKDHRRNRIGQFSIAKYMDCFLKPLSELAMPDGQALVGLDFEWSYWAAKWCLPLQREVKWRLLDALGPRWSKVCQLWWPGTLQKGGYHGVEGGCRRIFGNGWISMGRILGIRIRGCPTWPNRDIGDRLPGRWALGEIRGLSSEPPPLGSGQRGGQTPWSRLGGHFGSHWCQMFPDVLYLLLPFGRTNEREREREIARRRRSEADGNWLRRTRHFACELQKHSWMRWWQGAVDKISTFWSGEISVDRI